MEVNERIAGKYRYESVKEFCQFFGIPYRTVTDWELDNRHAPEYVLRLLEYYIRHENLCKENAEHE